MADTNNANYLAPHMPHGLQEFILKSRTAIANPAALPALEAAVKHSKDMPTGIAMFVMGIVTKAEQAMGHLNDKDIRLVIAHLAGTIVEIVKHAAAENPAALPPHAVEMVKDKKHFFQAVMFHALQLVNHASQQAAQQQAQKGAQPPQGGAPQPGGQPPQGQPPGAQGPQEPQGPDTSIPPNSVLGAMQGRFPSQQARSSNFLEDPADKQ